MHGTWGMGWDAVVLAKIQIQKEVRFLEVKNPENDPGNVDHTVKLICRILSISTVSINLQ